MIIDIDDKITAKVKPYNKESILDYELNSRDNRIGEITNIATSIENKYTVDEKWIKIYDEYISLLRVYQGKEIDFLKTGIRWQLKKSLRYYLKQLPLFLLHNYPSKLNRYYSIKNKNKKLNSDEDKIPLNAYQSPSPLNELRDYISIWEKKSILWDRSVLDTRCVILNNSLDLNNKQIIKIIKHLINEFTEKWKIAIESKDKAEEKDDNNNSINLDSLINLYKTKLSDIISNNEVLLANYVIKVCYSNLSINKTLAWRGYGDYIIQNLKKNSPAQKQTQIIEVPYQTNQSQEYLGKYYQIVEVGGSI